MARDELVAWLRLLEAPRVGRDSARKLLAAFGSPHAVIAASEAARRHVVGSGAAASLAQVPGLEALVDGTWEWLAGDSQRHVITLGDPAYPALLLETADPPLLLYAQGRTELLHAPAIAIVGSRNPTPQGASNAKAFASTLSRAGLTVVSGLALGVDAAAHEGALLESAATIAVVGTGLDRVYPRQHRELAHRIAHQGLIVSEYPLGTPPLQHNFPLRNRIIAGLSRGTLVVEAALGSGSLITARLAVEAGREVFAVPGSIHAPQARGCHALIRQGAKLVETAQDILEELGCGTPAAAGGTSGAADRLADPLLEALGHDPVTLDALVARTGWPAQDLNARLLELELEGHVARLPGQLFQRVATG
ncbi:DNA-processing protein DprA [Piscinibacter sp. XHJ-5]|uniref:DNA-processing protein DprA n=1 Tax=Piscinibacter sp. XHJ-5 TaxID=3037797 RepID=UPI00245364DA|nr:DNA-processing protein DprA [Piscinibacter sp. XHJ-5]